MTDIVDVPDIPVLPTPPSTNDPNNFSVRADVFLGDLPPWSESLEAVAESAKTNATAAREFTIEVDQKGQAQVALIQTEGATQIAGVRAEGATQIAAATVQANAAAGSAAAAASSATQSSGYADDAAASADLAKNAPTTYGTTAQALTLGAGAVNLTVEHGRAFMSGQAVVLASVANPTSQRMYGIVTAYNATTGALSVTVSAFTGSGVVTGWTVTLGNAPAEGGLSVVNIAANTDAATGNYYVFSDEGVTLTMPAAPAIGAEIGFCNASSGDSTVNWNGGTVKGAAPDPQAMRIPRYGSAIVKFNGSTWA